MGLPLTLVTRIFAESGATAVALITVDQTMEPQLGPDSSWDQTTVTLPVAPFPTGATQPFQDLQRYVRVSITISGTKSAALSVEGIAREST